MALLLKNTLFSSTVTAATTIVLALTFLGTPVSGSSGNSAVLDLTPQNFDKVVLKSGIPTLTEFFAPWCGHCKNLAPVYEELGQAFAHQSKVQIARVDADAHKDLGKKYGVQGFPTLKWFDGQSDQPVDDYSGGRDLESLMGYVTAKSGVRGKKKSTGDAESKVTWLTDQGFEEAVGKERDVFVAFTTGWCGHCKNLAPIWETLARDFSNEPSVLIGKVDCEAENSKALAESQGVQSYPTIKFFPKGSTAPVDYAGGRTEADFVDFLNVQAGTNRLVGGRLNDKAGTVDSLDQILAKYVTGGSGLKDIAKEMRKTVTGLKDKGAEYYVKVLGRLEAGEGYARKEFERLQGILKKGGLVEEKVDDLTMRSNVLRKFLVVDDDGKKKDGVKQEL